jgi:hypothetical protein
VPGGMLIRPQVAIGDRLQMPAMASMCQLCL